jgi:lipid II:glycine glycyltransferase (peptidoglycan interpeptide bridge formation enzyme)
VVDKVSEKGIQFFFSRRAILYGGPLTSDLNQREALNLLLKSLQTELHDKVIYIEIRNFKDYSAYSSVFTGLKWEYIPWLNIRKKLDFTDLSSLLASFNYNRRREILLTLKSGLTYGESNIKEDLSKVYRILKKLYKKRTGLPLPSLKYFEDLIETGLMKLFTVSDQGKIVGGSFCLVMPKEAIFTYYYCGERPYKPKTYPTHLAVLAAIEYGMKNGIKYLDFMGAGYPDEQYGVRNYKLEFGGNLIEEGRLLKVENKILYYLGVMAINMRKKLRT